MGVVVSVPGGGAELAADKGTSRNAVCVRLRLRAASIAALEVPETSSRRRARQNASVGEERPAPLHRGHTQRTQGHNRTGRAGVAIHAPQGAQGGGSSALLTGRRVWSTSAAEQPRAVPALLAWARQLFLHHSHALPLGQASERSGGLAEPPADPCRSTSPLASTSSRPSCASTRRATFPSWVSVRRDWRADTQSHGESKESNSRRRCMQTLLQSMPARA